MRLRPARAGDAEALAALWHEGWHAAHAATMPPALVAMRTRDAFAARTPGLLEGAVVAEDAGLAGFCAVRQDEVYQLYVRPAAQGTGAAAALLAEGEARIARAGFASAWLLCAEGNARARRFYERQGWRSAGAEEADLDGAPGGPPFRTRVLRFGKRPLSGG